MACSTRKTVAVRLIVPVALCAAALLPARATDVCGTIADHQTWTLAGSPYVATCEVVVAASGWLTVEAGVEVRFQAATRLTVNGRLDVAGTPAQRVQFTSNAATPARGDWTGVLVQGTATATIDAATIRWANRALHVTGAATATLDATRLQESREYGLYAYGNNAAALHVQATGCELTNNTLYGAYVYHYTGADPVVSLTGGAIHTNDGAYDLYANGFATPERSLVTATGTWWGTADAAAIAARIYDQSDNGNSPIVDRCGFLGAAGGAPVHDGYCPDPVVCDETGTWSATDKPYFVEQAVAVCAGATLRIGAGVTVKAAGGAATPVTVRGALEVGGTAAQRVLVTSSNAVPARGDWSGIVGRGTGTLVVQNASIEYARGGVVLNDTSTLTMSASTVRESLNDGLLLSEAPGATLTEVTLRDNGRHGLYAYGSSAAALRVAGTGCTMTGNGSYGAYVYHYTGADPVVSLTGGAIHGNAGTYDVYANGFASPARSLVTVTGNWWGTPDAAAIATRIYDQSDNGNSPIVDRCGFLASAGGAPVHDGYCPDPVVCDETSVWSSTDKPYFVEQLVAVCAGATLRIGAGVTVKAAGGAPTGFTVGGALEVQGTRAQPVTLTSSAAAPAAGDWNGITVRDSGTATAAGFSIRYGRWGIYAADGAVLTLTDATLGRSVNDGLYLGDHAAATLRGVALTDNARYGLYVYSVGTAGVRVRAGHCRVVGNASYGAYVYRYTGADPDVLVTGSALHGNGTYDLAFGAFSSGTALAWVPDNWWGSSELTTVMQRIYDHGDSTSRPTAVVRPFGRACDRTLGGDADGDSLGDVEDNCPSRANPGQADADGDRMGDACDPAPTLAPFDACDGVDDVAEGWLDADGDGWGDPCDFQPLRAEAHPGAPEICDARDDDGDGDLGPGETTDADRDEGALCGDCNESAAAIHACACENCFDVVDNDCDGATDGSDADCHGTPVCLRLAAGAEPVLTIQRAACGAGTPAGATQLIRGNTGSLSIAGGSVNLGTVACVAPNLALDRVTDTSPDPSYACGPVPSTFFLARYAGAVDFGAASTGERRNQMTPDPPCP